MGDSRPRVHLRQLAVRNHCTVDWNGMRGDDAVRFCGSCKNNVYNLSAMSEQDVEQLLARSEDVCVRYYYRADGTIVTSACPPTTRRSPSLAAAGVASALLYTSAFVGISAAVEDTDARAVAMRDDGIKVAMGGLKLNIKGLKRPKKKLASNDGLRAEEAQPAFAFQMPAQPVAATAHVWPVALLLGLGIVLAGLLTSWWVLGIAPVGLVTLLGRRRTERSRADDSAT